MRVEPPFPTEHAPFQSGYIARVTGSIEPVRALERQRDGALRQLMVLGEERGAFRYAPGKWSVKDVVGHIGDTERILSYRLLRIARGDVTPLPGFEENDYVEAAHFNRRRLTDLVEDWRAVRAATVRLVEGLTDDAWMRLGTANDVPTSARALLFVILGHVEHHRSILEERYGLAPIA